MYICRVLYGKIRCLSGICSRFIPQGNRRYVKSKNMGIRLVDDIYKPLLFITVSGGTTVLIRIGAIKF